MVQSSNKKTAHRAKRPTVAVIYEDLTSGYRYADWFALHGYQATMSSAVPQLEHHLKELCPDVIVVGLSSISTPLQTALPRLKKTCPQVPIIAMLDRTAPASDGAFPALAKAFGADVFMCDSLDPPVPLS